VEAADDRTRARDAVWAREPIPAGGLRVFLARPTSRAGGVKANHVQRMADAKERASTRRYEARSRSVTA
jgi:hypothetical protein